MLNRFIDWLIYLFKELGTLGNWLFTPITLNQDNTLVDLNSNGVILESSSAAVKTYNFFVRLFTWNWDFSTQPDPVTIIPIYIIGVTFITAIFIAMFIKVWVKR